MELVIEDLSEFIVHYGRKNVDGPVVIVGNSEWSLRAEVGTRLGFVGRSE